MNWGHRKSRPRLPGRNRMAKIAHARVPGRTRFVVEGLYRCTRLQQHLESRLIDSGLFKRVEASTVTGRLLLVYSRRVPLDEVIQVVDSIVDLAQPTGPAARKKQQPANPDFSESLYRIASAFDSWASPFIPKPIAAAVAGAVNLGEQILNDQEIQQWHMFKLAELLEKLGITNDTGLSTEEALQRLRQYGENSLAATERRSDLAIALEQFLNAPVAMLGASAVISILTGGKVDAAVILGVVGINAAIGFVTERQAEKTISSLSKTGVREVTVLRNGEEQYIPVETIVPGDLLILTPGSHIAADIRLLKSHSLSIDESALTGESLPVKKDHKLVAKQETALGDRRNMGYMGTHVTGGSGRGIVVATGRATELGQIQTMVGEAEAPETPMQRQLNDMGTKLAILCGVICGGVFGVGVLRGFAWLEMLKSSVSLAVAAVPEGLPAVATTTLAMGIGDMRKRNVSVRHLEAVETLGSVQVFCMDKTGTLTINRMSVVEVHSGGKSFNLSAGNFRDGQKIIDPDDREELVRLMQIVSLCSDTQFNGAGETLEMDGSPTEKALIQMAIDANLDVAALRDEHPVLRTRYRAEGRPYMSTLHQLNKGSYLLAVKGSPAEVLSMCDHQMKDNEIVELTPADRALIMQENENMAGRAMRVLGAGYRELDRNRMPSRPSQLTWLGLSGMADPMRPGMDELIKKYHRAGIKTIMITGDQSATANAIGRQLGLSGDKPLKVLESTVLETMDPKLLGGLARNVHVFARVSPAHKLKIVQALQGEGFIVAMTGDGINDGPALKAADIGVAMGGDGTNVARDVSDVVLEDDNLHTMTTAVRQGRTIYNNIRKMIHFMVSTNLTEIEVMLAGIATGLGEPMNPMQLLWINLVTDIFPGLALSMEPSEPGIMDLPPRDPDEPIISGRSLKRMGFESAVIGVGTMGAYLYGVKRYGIGAAASTLAFNTLTFNELVHSFSSRSPYRNVIGGQHLPPNPHLKRAILAMGGLQALVSTLPTTRRLLGTTPLKGADLLVIAAGVLLPLLINELTKPKAPDTIINDYNEEPEIVGGDINNEEMS